MYFRSPCWERRCILLALARHAQFQGRHTRGTSCRDKLSTDDGQRYPSSVNWHVNRVLTKGGLRPSRVNCMTSNRGQNVHLIVSSLQLVISSCRLFISSRRHVISLRWLVISSCRLVISSRQLVISSCRLMVPSCRPLNSCELIISSPGLVVSSRRVVLSTCRLVESTLHFVEVLAAILNTKKTLAQKNTNCTSPSTHVRFFHLVL